VARIVPYRSRIERGDRARFAVEVVNPLPNAAWLTVDLVIPSGWTADRGQLRVELESGARAELEFWLTAPAEPERRSRIAVDVTVGDVRFGQHAEAIVTAI